MSNSYNGYMVNNNNNNCFLSPLIQVLRIRSRVDDGTKKTEQNFVVMIILFITEDFFPIYSRSLKKSQQPHPPHSPPSPQPSSSFYTYY